MKFATTPCTSQGGALKIIRIINNALIFRPLLSSCCSLCLPQAAVTNEPVLKEIIIYLFNSVSILEALFLYFLSNYSLCNAPQKIDFCFENTVYILFSKDIKFICDKF
jgi:hypothetical protein